MSSIIGKIIGGRYEIVDLLGNGGFSNTYLARDKQLPNTPYCVVKHFQPKSTNSFAVLETAKRLFNTEAEILYKLGRKIDRVPQLLAHLEEDGEFYLVEEFIEGKNFKQELISDRRFGEERVITFLEDVLSLLSAVHQQGFIHRDIKPENLIRRNEDGKMTLIDFGAGKQISLQVNSQALWTQNEEQIDTTVIIGTPGYMPTEQQVGKPRFSSDIYAVGSIAIQALTGLPPTQIPEDPQTGEIGWRDYVQVSQKFAAIVDKMVSNHFKERYQSAEAVLKDLQKLQSPQSLITTLGSSIERRSGKFKLGWLAAGIILLLSIVGGKLLESKQAQQSRLVPNEESISTKKLFVDRLALANSLTVHSGPVFAIAISPNGQNFVSGSGDNTVKLWNLPTGELLHTFTGHSKEVVTVAISPDGQTLASGSRDGTVKIWNLQTRELLHTLNGHPNKVVQVVSVAISPDGQTLVSGNEDATIAFWDLKTGKLLRQIDTGSIEVEFVAISPNGQSLVSVSEDKKVRIWNLQTGKLLRTLTGHQGEIETVAISPDGQTIVSGAEDKILIWKLATGELLRALPEPSGLVRSVAVSPDGQTLASSHEDNTIKLWDLSTGKLLRTLSGHSDWVLSVAIDRDGQTLVSGSRDKKIAIWRPQ